MTEEKRIRMNLKAWSYKDFVDFMTAFQTGDTDTSFRLATRLVASWDYDVDLSSAEPLMELGVAESAKVLRTIVEAVGKYAEDTDFSGVKVDFSIWNTRRFILFDNKRRQGKVDDSIAMLHEIASTEGVSKEGTLSFEDGVRMFKAVSKAYEKIVTGKN